MRGAARVDNVEDKFWDSAARSYTSGAKEPLATSLRSRPSYYVTVARVLSPDSHQLSLSIYTIMEHAE